MTPGVALAHLKWRGAKQTLYMGVKLFLRKFGYDIVDHNSEPLEVLPLAVDLIVNRIGAENFFFIQIGANDGIRTDPLHPLIEKYRLKGLLVEPLPDMHKELIANYERCPGLAYVNAAISENSDDLPLYRFKRDATVEDQCHGWASTDEERLRIAARRQRLNFEQVIEKVVVPSMSFNELLSKHHIAQYNLLQVDTEGDDYKILRMALAEDIRPQLINFESGLLTANDKLRSHNLLREKGYRYFEVGLDTIAMNCNK